MAQYSIRLGREYDMVKYIERLESYFERDGLESELLNNEMVIKLTRMKKLIADKITNHIRVLGSILLTKPETEFFL